MRSAFLEMLECVETANSGVHTLSTHCDSIRYTNRVVLPCQHVVVQDVLLDFLPKIQHYPSSVHYVETILACIAAFACVTHSACCIIVSTVTTNPKSILTCKDCPPTRRSQFPRGAASSSLPVMVHQLRIALPKGRNPLVNEVLQSSWHRVANLGSGEVVTGCECR